VTGPVRRRARRGLRPFRAGYRSAVPPDLLRLSVPAEPAAVRSVRSRLRHWLAGHADGDRSDDAALVASEIVTNAVQAGVPGSVVGIAARLVGSTLYLVVVNELPGEEHELDLDALAEPAVVGSEVRPSVAMPPTSAVRGRGLPIVDALVDWWTLVQDGQAVVRCRMDLTPQVARRS
jgi:anti-sigma regulatory factor (Ser/Thr protein kinase)